LSFALYLDEDVDIRVAVQLRRDGFDVLTTRDAGRAHQGLADESQLIFAAENSRAILTRDTGDYSDLALAWAEQGKEHYGIILSNRTDVGQIVTGVRLIQSWYPDGIANYCLHLP
jgi:hypothetical protein